MSRIGKQPIEMPKEVSASLAGNTITVRGPKGELSYTWNEGIAVEAKDNILHITRSSDSRFERSQHGLARTMINNMVIGVSQGYNRELEISGVGFRAEVQGDSIAVTVGFTNPAVYKLPKGVSAKVQKNTRIILESIDKQKVGMAASEIRAIRPPEPYKGKGIKYADEQIKRKVGKTTA